MANSLLAQAAAAYNSGRRNQFPTSGPVAPLSFATTPQGQREMDNVRAQLQADIARNQQAAQRRAMFRTPAGPPPIGEQIDAELAQHMKVNPAGNPFEDGGGMASVQGSPNDSALAAMASAYNAQAPSQVPIGGYSPRTAAAIEQHPQIMADGGMASPMSMFANPAFANSNGPYASQTGIRPDQNASAGLLAGNPAADGGMFGDTRWQPGGRMSGYRPQSVGMADPRTREAQMRQQAPAAPVDAAEQLRQMAPGLMNQAANAPNGRQVMELPSSPLLAQGMAGQQGAAERLREMLSPEQQANIELPTGIRGSSKTREGGVVAGSRAYWQQRQMDPSYQAFAAKQQALASEAKQRVAMRNQRAQDAADGIDPSFRRAQEMLLGGVGAPAAGGQFAPGGMNAGQIGALAFMYGPELAAQAMKFNAEAANQQAANALAAGQLGLQQQIANNQIQQQKDAAWQAMPPGHERNVAMVRSNPQGFKGLTPEQQRSSVLDALTKHFNAFASANARQKLTELGIDPVDAYIALDGMLPASTLGRLGGLPRRGAEVLKGNGDPVATEQAYRQYLAAEAAKRGYKPRNQ